MLDKPDNKIVAVILEALKNLLKMGALNFVENNENVLLAKFEEVGCLQKVEKL